MATADTTAPTLTSASASATSGTASSGSVTTNEANGTLYWLTNTSSTATATAVKAGSSQAVTAAGAQSTSSTGLSPGTTYYTHFLHRDAAGNDSAVLSSASFTTPAPDATAPTFTGSITVGAKTSSTIALTLPAASDNVAVTGYQYRINGGAWVDNGNSTAVALSGLAALASYTIDARAYDAGPNYSTMLSVTTSTYRAGASAGSIVAATGPQDGQPAGWLYALAQTLPVDAWVSFRLLSGPTPAGGTLDVQPNGAGTYIGPSPATVVIQPEVNGVDAPETTSITLFDQTVLLVGSSDRISYADAGGAALADPALLTGGSDLLSPSDAGAVLTANLALLTGGSDLLSPADAGALLTADLAELLGGADVLLLTDEGGAVTPFFGGWPQRGVRIIVPLAGPEPTPIRMVVQYGIERIVYELDFESKFLAQVGDTAQSLVAFTAAPGLPAESRTPVGSQLSSGLVMFSVGRDAPVGSYGVVVAISTTGGFIKACKVQIEVVAP